jgi:RNA polymerase sigma factor (sigma-70 family)
MDSLTAKQREILKLKYIDGFTITEIAELLKCSHQNVSKLNSSAINSMQKALEL